MIDANVRVVIIAIFKYIDILAIIDACTHMYMR